ncbi:MAG: hypothetical protein K9K67_01265 [Bacteriovoracaceae bacterium]|nr:hypothetical protein [Bacteriovoracaceae bacterium]
MNEKQRKDNEALKIITILRLDAQRVFERIKYREPEYMQFFSAKRTREHFPEVFKHRYDDVTVKDLMNCGEEVIVGLDQFYALVDDLKWYLMVTNDMPGTVNEHVRHAIKELEEGYELLQLYIGAELDSYRKEKPPQVETPDASFGMLEHSLESIEDNFSQDDGDD